MSCPRLLSPGGRIPSSSHLPPALSSDQVPSSSGSDLAGNFQNTVWFQFARTWVGGAGGVTAGSEPSRVWLDHRRCSSGLRDKTWQLLWKSGEQPWGRSSACSCACSMQWRGDGRAHGRQLSPHPWLPGQSAPHRLSPSPSSQRQQQEEEACANAQLSECTHRA